MIETRKRLEVVWVPRNYLVRDLLEQYVARDIDYLALVTAFRKRGWSTAGLHDVVQQMEHERDFRAFEEGKFEL